MHLEIVTLSKAGGRKENQDACGYFVAGETYCCVLSDGLGGHAGGAIASKLAVQKILDLFKESPQNSREGINTLLHAANNAILARQQRDLELKAMRTTAVVLTIDTVTQQAFWGHIGDSRLYCFQRGRIIVQTRDHSISQRMVDAGYLKPADLRFSPGRNQLLGAMGDKDHFEIEMISAPFNVHDSDVFLLCSDGLWEYVEENEMAQLLQSSQSAAQWAELLEAQVLERGGAGQDNYSAVIVWCSQPGELTQRL